MRAKTKRHRRGKHKAKWKVFRKRRAREVKEAMKSQMKILTGGLLLVLALAACTHESGTTGASQRAINKAKSHSASVYSPTHDIEFHNYNERQRISDDPSTILWCTSAFPIPSSPLFTVPIVGKMTSGSKRPYPTERALLGTENYGYFNPEVPGPDGMYGPSDAYRYGFTPQGIYAEWANMPTYCSTEPTIWQRDNTTIALASDPTLLAAQKEASRLIAAGQSDEAEAVLEAAIAKVQNP